MADPLFSVADQIVLVSGGNRGIGKAIAQGFAEREAQVIITGRDEAKLQEAVSELSDSAKHPVKGVICDVSDLKAIQRLVADVINEFDHIDTLVNVAGVNRRKPTIDVTEDDYDYIVDINLKGAFFLSQQVGKHMLETEKGSQIQITSINNDRPLKGVTPYALSKGGMGTMTQALALEWGPKGVRVNALAPGFILTDLTRKLWSNPHMQEWNFANTPLARLGQPEDMIGTAIFLASDASAFVTGQIIYVDGGFTAGVNWPIDFDKQ